MREFKQNCECVYCKNFKPFDFDDHLIDEIKAGNTVLFIGAGVSTENPNSHKYSFYDEMLHAVKKMTVLFLFRQLPRSFVIRRTVVSSWSNYYKRDLITSTDSRI